MRPQARHGSALSKQRAFVLHLGAHRAGGRRRFSGSVEHLSSGESALFTSRAGSLVFFDTAVDTAAPWTPAEQPEPCKDGRTLALPDPRGSARGAAFVPNDRPDPSRREGER